MNTRLSKTFFLQPCQLFR